MPFNRDIARPLVLPGRKVQKKEEASHGDPFTSGKWAHSLRALPPAQHGGQAAARGILDVGQGDRGAQLLCLGVCSEHNILLGDKGISQRRREHAGMHVHECTCGRSQSPL